MRRLIQACCIGLCVLLSGLQAAEAATATSRATGNWNTGSTWSLTRTGTITANVASATVTGAGTNFLTELSVGNVIMNAAGTVVGTVQAIASNTSLTLTANAAVAVAGAAWRRG